MVSRASEMSTGIAIGGALPSRANCCRGLLVSVPTSGGEMILQDE
jgi:hypothetical protein